MPDLVFRVTGVEAAAQGLTPLFLFRVEIDATPESDRIAGVLLNAQIQLQCPQRSYTPTEKSKLFELFGPLEQWGQTLRNRLWTYASAGVGAFSDHTQAVLPVPCTYDLNVASAKYLYALESGVIPLLFLFSGSVFYAGPGGHVQLEPISWSKECVYQMPVQAWHELMERHYPNSAWLPLHREMFDRLTEYKRRHALTSWDDVLNRLLAGAAASESSVSARAAGRLNPIAEVPV